MRFLFLLILILSHLLPAQELNNENIWYHGSFYPDRMTHFNFMNDGVHYTKIEENAIVQYNFLDPSKKKKILLSKESFIGVLPKSGLSDYQFSPNERYILLAYDQQAIYRHSFLARYYLYDRETNFVIPLGREPIRNVSFDPTESRIAYVNKHNLYFYDIEAKKHFQITTDGRKNHILNGIADWVYEEEFSITRLYEWSANGKYLAYLKLDESEVREFDLNFYQGGLYPDKYEYKYPKVGMDNAKVSAHIYEVEQNQNTTLDLGEYEYIPRLSWMGSDEFCTFTLLNRHQNHLRWLRYHVPSAKKKLWYEEKSQEYIDIRDDQVINAESGDLYFVSGRDDYKQIYALDKNGDSLSTLTHHKFPVTKIYGLDKEDKVLYYQASGGSPMDRYLYALDIANGRSTRMMEQRGYHEAQFNSTFRYFVHSFNQLNVPARYSIRNSRDASLVRKLTENAHITMLQNEHNVQEIEFIRIPSGSGEQLNGYIMPPAEVEKGKSYPLLMYVYGGPGSQQVLNKMPGNYWWFQMLSKMGYYVACVDGRGTGGRSEKFQKGTYLQLGKYETEDQIMAAKYLSQQAQIDPDRIGIFGWSFGGYLSSLAVLKGHETFAAAVAVAPVTSWRWYDNIYTERYMRTYEENQSGYDENSPVNFADQLEDPYLIIHGGADDNVHPQHTHEMVEALVANNKKFDMMLYPNKNHGIYGSFTRWHLFDRITEFLEESLKKEKNGK